MPQIKHKLSDVIENEFGTTAEFQMINRTEFESFVEYFKSCGFTDKATVDNTKLKFSALNDQMINAEVVVDGMTTHISVYSNEKHFSTLGS